MKRNLNHEAQVMFLMGSYDGSRMTVADIEEQDEQFAAAHGTKAMENDEIWNAINCLIDQGAVATASKTADYFRITFAGYSMFKEEMGLAE